MAADAPALQVLCTLGLAGVMAELTPAFEAANGARLAVRLGPAAELSQELDSGAPFDVAILTDAAVDMQIAKGRLAAGSRVDIAKSCVGVTVPPGTQKPDIGTVEAFRQTLLAAKSIVFTGRGASGQHFASLLPRLGIEDEVRRKATVIEGLIAKRVVTGEIALGIQQISEILAVPGAVLVGPLPAELQKYTVFSAGLGAHAANAGLAKALLKQLADPATIALAQSKGMEPA